LKALLWAVHQGLSEIPPPPPAGLTSLPADPAVPGGFLEAAGFRLCGVRAVRIDMLERLGDIIRAKGKDGQMPDAFTVSPDMMSVLGCGEEDMAQVLRSLGFRDSKTKTEAGEETTQWQMRQRREERRPRPQRQQRRPQQRPAPSAAPAPYGQPTAEVATAAPGEQAQQQRREHREHRGKDQRHKDHRSKDQGPKDHKPKQQHQQKDRPRRPEKPFVVDPDSPFAALAALKFQK
jgi:ATP-dependent RNA helicase SUPV3L1/SUV3